MEAKENGGKGNECERKRKNMTGIRGKGRGKEWKDQGGMGAPGRDKGWR